MKFYVKTFERVTGEWLGACTFGDSDACEVGAIEAGSIQEAARKAAALTVSGGFVDAPIADGGLFLRVLAQCEGMATPEGIEVEFQPVVTGLLDSNATSALRGAFRWDMTDAVKGAEDQS